jgi:hypothetical protein
LKRKWLKEIPGMRNNPQKDKEQQKVKKLTKISHQRPKREIVWGMEEKTANWAFYSHCGVPVWKVN